MNYGKRGHQSRDLSGDITVLKIMGAVSLGENPLIPQNLSAKKFSTQDKKLIAELNKLWKISAWKKHWQKSSVST